MTISNIDPLSNRFVKYPFQFIPVENYFCQKHMLFKHTFSWLCLYLSMWWHRSLVSLNVLFTYILLHSYRTEIIEYILYFFFQTNIFFHILLTLVVTHTIWGKRSQYLGCWWPYYVRRLNTSSHSIGNAIKIEIYAEYRVMLPRPKEFARNLVLRLQARCTSQTNQDIGSMHTFLFVLEHQILFVLSHFNCSVGSVEHYNLEMG